MDNTKKVLVAEDDSFLAAAYRAKLTKAGFNVKLVGDGEEAINSLQTEIPDLILLDVVMPKKDGFATLEEIKKDERFKNIPVIIASNLGQSEDVVRGMKLGAVDYIVKSGIKLEDVVNKINAHLTQQ